MKPAWLIDVVTEYVLVASAHSMQKRHKIFKSIVRGGLLALVVYVAAYICNSASGGYWLQPGRDGHVRYGQEFGGLSLTVAIMWQPRFGHNALGQRDHLGLLFEPLILLDRACLHPTHYLVDEVFENWLKQLPASKVHPKFREEFVRERAKEGPKLASIFANGSRTPSAYPDF